MGKDNDGVGRLGQVPDAKSAIARGRGKDVGLAGVPNSRVDTVGMLVEGADRVDVRSRVQCLTELYQEVERKETWQTGL